MSGLWDHLRGGSGAGPEPVPECWTVLSALAEATSRVMLGPLVLNVANRHAGVLANMAATLQEVSGGRLLLGLGAGGSRATPYAAEQDRDRPPGRNRHRTASGARARDRAHPRALGRRSARLPAPLARAADHRRRLRPAHGGARRPTRRRLQHRRGSPAAPRARHARARARTPKSGRATPFQVSAFGGFPGTEAGRKRLAGLGVERLILLVQPPFAELRARA